MTTSWIVCACSSAALKKTVLIFFFLLVIIYIKKVHVKNSSSDELCLKVCSRAQPQSCHAQDTV